jgi:hypothetical protein
MLQINKEFFKLNKFETRLVDKYGVEILDDFKKIKINPYWRLADIGRKHGFTRERARQIFNRIYKTTCMKTRKKINKELSCAYDPRIKVIEYTRSWKMNADVELLFFNECKKRSFNVKILCSGKGLLINGRQIKTRASFGFKYRKCITPRYYFSTRLSYFKEIDFFACYHKFLESFFIIPAHILKPNQTIYILAHKSNYPQAKNKYFKYREAWHLLNAKMKGHI